MGHLEKKNVVKKLLNRIKTWAQAPCYAACCFPGLHVVETRASEQRGCSQERTGQQMPTLTERETDRCQQNKPHDSPENS